MPTQKQLRNATIVCASLFLAGVMLLAFGCAARVAHVTDTPAGVSEQQARDWDAAIAGLHRIAILNTTLRKSVIALRENGAFPDDKAYAAVLLSIGKIAQTQTEAASFLEQQPKHFSDPGRVQFSAYLTTISQELTQLNQAGTTGIKNADSLRDINGIINEIEATAKLVIGLQL